MLLIVRAGAQRRVAGSTDWRAYQNLIISNKFYVILQINFIFINNHFYSV
jgi:hypothetical protein